MVPLVCFNDCLTLPTSIDLARSLGSNLAGTVVPSSHITPAIPAKMPDVSPSRSAQWPGMFDIRCASHGQQLYVADIHIQMAEELSSHLRQRVTLPEPPDAGDLCYNGAWLGRTACAFLNCRWICPNCSISDSQNRSESNRPWDIMLREHVASAHRSELDSVFSRFPDVSASRAWDIYLGALAVQERKNWPCVGSSIDRRSFAVTASVYNDARIRSLLCFACACIKPGSGRHNSEIEFKGLTWSLSLPPGALRLNFSIKRFRDLFARPGTPLHPTSTSSGCNLPQADFTDWTLRFSEEHSDTFLPTDLNTPDPRGCEMMELYNNGFICCPEDHHCTLGHCKFNRVLCPDCQAPLVQRVRTSIRGWQGHTEGSDER